jgi:hypothetical protein
MMTNTTQPTTNSPQSNSTWLTRWLQETWFIPFVLSAFTRHGIPAICPALENTWFTVAVNVVGTGLLLFNGIVAMIVVGRWLMRSGTRKPAEDQHGQTS